MKTQTGYIEVGTTLRAWSYTSLPVTGICRIDGQPLRMRMRLELEDTQAIPDVLAIEEWLDETCCRNEATVEEYALAALERWGGRITMVGRTRTHGRIRVTVGN